MASNALNAGIPEHIVQKMGNWKDRRMLARYAHLADENLRQAESKLTSILEGRARLSHNVTTRVPGPRANKKAGTQVPAFLELIGGADETRTRDLRSDSPVC